MMKVKRGNNSAKLKKATGFSALAALLADLGREAYSRGWAMGTSGNFSAVASRNPFRMWITPTGVDKDQLTAKQLVVVNAKGKLVEGSGQPSEETALHLAVVRARQAGAVLHTHSIWSTILSDEWAGGGGLSLEGYEMLKGLEGVETHEQREWLPILENTQDMAALASSVEETLAQHASAHGLLLRRHGLYTWGEDLAQAKRHLEILEFLLEMVGRTHDARH